MSTLRRGLICGIALVAASAGCTEHRSSGSSAAPATTSTTAAPAPPVPLTAAQLDAHLGAGAPKGWYPVDGGNARLWVPPDWTFTIHGACDGSGSFFVGSSSTLTPPDADGRIPNFPSDHCKPTRAFQVPTSSISFIHLTSKPHTTVPMLVHGYRVYLVKRAAPAARWNTYDVPELRVAITTHGPLGARILRTLGASTRYVALHGAPADEARPLRPITAGGVSLSIPRAWRVARLTEYGCGSLDPRPALTLVDITPSPDGGPMGGCGGAGPTGPTSTPAARGLVRTGGVWLYVRREAGGPNQDFDAHEPGFDTTRGTPVATLRHGDTTINAWVRDGSNDFELFARRDGSSIVHALQLVGGRDGRVAAGVLASIRATT